MESIDNIDDIKALWTDLNTRISVLEEENRRLISRVKNDKYRSIKDRLISRYRVFVCLGIVSAFVFPMVLFVDPMTMENYRWPTAIYFFLFFWLCAAVDFYLLENVKRMDLYNSSVTEIANLAAKNWKIHKLWLFLGIPLAFIALILWGLALNADYFVILGMIAGGFVGFVIGLRMLLKFRKDYRFLQSPAED